MADCECQQEQNHSHKTADEMCQSDSLTLLQPIVLKINATFSKHRVEKGNCAKESEGETDGANRYE